MAKRLAYIILTLVLMLVIGTVVVNITGCKTKQYKNSSLTVAHDSSSTSANKEVQKEFDSTYVKEAVKTKTILDNPCDSLGQLINLYNEMVSGQSKTKVYTETNKTTGKKQLIVETSCDEVVNRYERSLKVKDSVRETLVKDYISLSQQHKEVKTEIPFKFWVWLVCSVVLNVLLIYVTLGTIFNFLKR